MNGEDAHRASHVSGVDGPQHGRRARRSSAANTEDMAAAAAALEAAQNGIAESNDTTGTSLAAATHRQQQKREDTELQANIRHVHDEVDEATRQDQIRKMQEEKERFAQKIAEAPTSYQTAMPRLSDLDIKSSWDRLLRSIHSECDMSCLTTCLSRELDEDEAWNPEMLLVALTSDMLDAKETGGGDVLSPVDPQSIGLMAGGEVSRKRKEKVVPGANEGSDKAPPAPGKQAFQKRGSDNSNGPRGGSGGGGGSGAKSGAGTSAAPAPTGGRRAGGGEVTLKSPTASTRPPSHAVAPLSSNAQELSRKESKKAMKEKEKDMSRKSSKKSMKESN